MPGTLVLDIILIRDLQRIQKVRPIITSHPDLLLTLPLMHIIPLPTPPSSILGPQLEIDEKRAAKQTDDLIP